MKDRLKATQAEVAAAKAKVGKLESKPKGPTNELADARKTLDEKYVALERVRQPAARAQREEGAHALNNLLLPAAGCGGGVFSGV